MSRHKATVLRPRWGRLALAGVAASITGVALVGGATQLAAGDAGTVARDTTSVAAASDTDSSDSVSSDAVSATDVAEVFPAQTLHRDKALPDDSGSGYRIVYSESRQRVWLVGSDEAVERTYLVSGSVYDNLDPGSYSVFSRSEHAFGIDDSGTMNHFVRFAEGPNAAIGFHDIPVDDGAPVQTNDDLGTPQSHGCIRQKPADALALWDFAPVGTSVVVTA